MAIELGLSRICNLLSHLGNPQNSFKVLHVAGTNGKGSVCSLLQSVLQTNKKYQVGKFTSPHLVHITDCISVNGKSIPLQDFQGIKNRLQETNKVHEFGCTEFELLTCTAFEYFQRMQCNWCVLEVGLGGRLDATNCSPGANKICGITKIGMDHQGFLGDTLAQIGTEKAGMIVSGVSFVAVDGSNEPEVLDVVKKRAAMVNAVASNTSSIISGNIIKSRSWGNIDRAIVPLNGSYQVSNVAVAVSMLDYLQSEGQISISSQQIHDGLKNVRWPGRLQNVSYYKKRAHKALNLLIDGAHNGDAAAALAAYLAETFRPQGTEPITFVIAVTQGKAVDYLLAPLIKQQDTVIVTRFGSVEGMPWISPMELSDLESKAARYTDKVSARPSIQAVLDEIPHDHPDPVVVCGSLYLCGELLRDENVAW
ncbi:LAME_0G17392g1_1 [Lachancea meyersii CBS 8951]|uniref:Dihydrofolate synthetase n=1 Tax=Lachancea meyersii CBS 8951 TaxID=1266667 RepID=A0A1G4KBE9_9SACH|nr:LAME_0G17392g1_1 [Lachancea meyersii CBS 8951]